FAAACAAGPTNLITPMFAAVILAAIDQIFRSRAERVIRLAKWRDLAVAVIVDADIEPNLRHPLRVTHGASPGAAPLLRRAPAALDNAHRIDQLAFPIGLAPWLVPGQCGKRRKYRAHVILLHQRIAVRGFDTPKGEQRAAFDAEIALDTIEQRGVVLQRLL